MTGRHAFGVITILVALMTVITFQSQAQAEGDKNYLVRGSWSLQFRISENFTLSSFEGALISAKRHLSNNSAIRFGLSLSGSTNDLSSDRNSILEDSTDLLFRNSSSDTDRDNISVGLTSQLMFYTTSDKTVNFYFGVGPDLNYTRSKQNGNSLSDENSTPYSTGTSESYDRAWSFGMLGSWGVEWFVTRKLSIMAEYGASMEYFSQYRDRTSTTIQNGRTSSDKIVDKDDGFRFVSSNVNFGLSVYF